MNSRRDTTSDKANINVKLKRAKAWISSKGMEFIKADANVISI